MYIRLKQKPFYFLTDRDTKYTYFVDNTSDKIQKHLYYPELFQTMSSHQIRAFKNSLVNRFIFWSLFNSEKMTVTDKKICHSKIVDLAVSLAGGLLCASFMRRFFFRIELPFLQMALQNSFFSSRWIKSAVAYSASGLMTYKAINTILKEQYLVDLAFQYRYNFNKELTCKECDKLLIELCHQRFQNTIVQTPKKDHSIKQLGQFNVKS